MEPPAAGENPGSVHRPRRKPLQPRDSNASPAPDGTLPKPKPKPIPIPTEIPPLVLPEPGKEDRPIAPPEPREASLAEELGAVRRQRERLQAERERTERLLKERGLMLERAMKEMMKRGEEQRRMELELQRLIWLKELRSSCMKFSPVQALRAKEEEKRSAEEGPQELMDHGVTQHGKTTERCKPSEETTEH